MHILVTNDDGIASAGVWALAGALHTAGFGIVTIIAPEAEHSGASMSFPPQRDHAIYPVVAPDPAYAAIAAFAYRGTPVGCVTAGMLAEVGPRPDMVVSGINRGINAGTNVMLSGTVGAAMAAAMWGLPAMAVSLQFVGDAPMQWPVAAYAATRVFPLLRDLHLRAEGRPLVLNVNVPHLTSPEQLRGFRQTGLSDFFYGRYLYLNERESGERDGHTLRYAFDRSRAIAFPESSDDGAVRAGYVSVTPLVPIAVHPDVDLAQALAEVK